jgi:hypothetical protein
MTPEQSKAFAAPLIGRDGDRPTLWLEPPWAIALSFNR